MSRYEILKTFNGEVYIRGISFNSISDIERQIDDTVQEVESYKHQLMELIVATPNSIAPAGESPIDYVKNRAENVFDAYNDAQEKLDLLMFARGIIHDWTFKNPGLSAEQAFEIAYVDKYADLRQQLNHE